MPRVQSEIRSGKRRMNFSAFAVLRLENQGDGVFSKKSSFENRPPWHDYLVYFQTSRASILEQDLGSFTKVTSLIRSSAMEDAQWKTRRT
jgi:hypothetical protein